ncbi:HsdS Restriction endonuclease S subunits [Candidatus Nanopelagicaceae bacterium]
MQTTTWRSLRLGELCDLQQGLCINKKSKHLLVEKSDLPLLRITDLLNDTQKQFIDPNLVSPQFIADDDSLVYTRTGQVGHVFKDIHGVVYNNCFKIKPNALITKDYLYYLLKQSWFLEKVLNIASKSAQKDLTHNSFKSIVIQIPDLAVQEEIGQKLSSLDAAIKKNTELMNLISNWIQEEFIDIANNCENSPSILNDVAERINIKYDEELHSGLPLVDLATMDSKSIFIRSFKESDALKSSRILFTEGDVLFSSIRCYLHKVVVVPFDGITNVSAFVIRSKNDVLKSWVKAFLFNDDTVLWASSKSNGTKMPTIDWGLFSTIPIVIPDDVQLDAFNQLSNPGFALISNLSKQNMILEQMKQLEILKHFSESTN